VLGGCIASRRGEAGVGQQALHRGIGGDDTAARVGLGLESVNGRIDRRHRRGALVIDALRLGNRPGTGAQDEQEGDNRRHHGGPDQHPNP